MEGSISETLLLPSIFLTLYVVMKVAYVFWLRPKGLEKHLRKQGIKGTSYKILHGDVKEIARSNKEALSKPLSLNHHIAPRVFPFFFDMVQNYGKLLTSS